MPELETATFKELIQELKRRENMRFVAVYMGENSSDWNNSGLSFSPWMKVKDAESLLNSGAGYLESLGNSGQSDF